MSQLLKEYYPFANDKLPRGWNEVSVGAITTEIRSGFSSGRHNTDGIGIPHLRPMSVTSDGAVTLQNVRYIAPSSGDLRLIDGDILFTNTSSTIWVGKTGVVRNPGDWAFSNHMTRLRLKEGLIPEFFAKQLHFLCRCGFFAHHCTEHVNQSSIAPSLLRDRIPLRVPPIAEQRRLMARLDTLESKSRQARANLAEIPTQLNQTRQSLFMEAFSGRLTASLRARNKHEILWQRLKFSDLISDLKQGWSPRCETVAANSSEWGVIKTTAIQSLNFNPLENKRLPKHLDPDPSLSIKAGDVLLTRAGPRSRCGITAITHTSHPKLMVCDKVYRLRANGTKITPAFLALLLNSPVVLTKLEAAKTGASENGMNITQAKLLNLTHKIPPLSEQINIIHLVNAALKRIDSALTAHAAALADLNRLDQSLLMRAFRGQLVKQDPDDESAELFLERFTSESAIKLKESKKFMPRKPKSSAAREIRLILDVLHTISSGLSPEELFQKSGYDETDLEQVEKFYADLRQLVNAGKVKEKRVGLATIILTVVP